MELWIAAAGVLVGQCVKGVTGFGAALVMVPVFAWLWSPAEAIFVSTSINCVAGAVLVASVWRDLQWRLVGAMVVGVPVGLWLGIELLTRLPVPWVLMGISGVVGVFAVRMLVAPSQPGRGELESLPEDARMIYLTGAVAGSLAGLMGGLAGVPGPPLVIYARRWFAPLFFRSHLIAAIQLVALSLASTLMARGAVPPERLGQVVVLLVPMVVGLGMGTWLSQRVSRTGFVRVVGTVLLVSAMGLGAKALSG